VPNHISADNDRRAADRHESGSTYEIRTTLDPAQRKRRDEGQGRHAHDGTNAEHGHVTERLGNGTGRSRQYQQAGGTGRAVHHANAEGATQSQALVPMLVRAFLVSDLIVSVGVQMQMRLAAGMPVNVSVGTLPPQRSKDVRAEHDDHHADGHLEYPFGPAGNAFAQKHESAANRQQRDGVPDAPEAASEHQRAARAALLAQRRNGGEMVRLQGMLHADQQTKQQ